MSVQIRTRYGMLRFRYTCTESEIENLLFNARRCDGRSRVFASKPSASTGKAAHHRYVLINNNNSDSGYFAYSNNRMPPLCLPPPPRPSSSKFPVAPSPQPAWSWLARSVFRTDASRFAWQVTRNLFACQRTRLSPLIPSPKLLGELRRDLPTRRVYLELLLMLLLSICLAAEWSPKRIARVIAILLLSWILASISIVLKHQE